MHMIILAISGFVLALCACGAGVALWITCFRTKRALASVTSNAKQLFSRHEHELKEISATVKQLKLSAPAALQAEVAELSAAVGRLGKTQQRLAGAFYAGRTVADPPGHGHNENSAELDDLLALQRAPSVSPGG